MTYQIEQLPAPIEGLVTLARCGVGQAGQGQTDQSVVVMCAYSNVKVREGLITGAYRWLKRGYDVLQIFCPENDWYQSLQEDQVVAIADVLDQYKGRRIGFGSSMGGFGVIALSGRFALDTVAADAPVFVRTSTPNERVRLKDMSAVRDWDDSARYGVRHANPDATFLINYDPNTVDGFAVERLHEVFPNATIEHLRLRGAGHPTMSVLMQSGAYPDDYLDAVEAGSLDTLDPRMIRRGSPSMQLNLAARMAARGHLAPARKLSDRAFAALLEREEISGYHIRDRLEVLNETGDYAGIWETLALVGPGLSFRFDVRYIITAFIDAAAALDKSREETMEHKFAYWLKQEPWGVIGLAEQALKDGNLRRATRCLETLRPFDAQTPVQAVLLWYEIALAGTDLAHAARCLEEAIALGALRKSHWHFFEGTAALAKGLNDLADLDLALNVQGHILDLWPMPWQFFQRAGTLQAMGRFEEALKDAQVAKKGLPDEPAPATLLLELERELG